MLIFLQCVCSIIAVTNCDRLVSVVSIFRHGDRNPFTTYRTDPYKDESHWPEGLGQLTKSGMQRQYDLGQWLRLRYTDMLPLRYSPKSIRMVSTDVDRTLMSAQTLLAGLYQPQDADKFNKTINWQPIPIHTTPTTSDAMLAAKKPCNKYERLFRELLESEDMKRFDHDHRELYDFLSDKTGENVTNFYDVEIIHNALHSQFLANKTLPRWAFEVYPHRVRAPVALRYRSPCYNQQLARLKTGLLFGEVVKHFQKRIRGSFPLVLLFSAHDSTLANVLTAMNAFNDEVPSYSSTVIFELFQNTNAYYVNVLFKNATGLYNLTLETCDFNCGFGDFTQILSPVVVYNVTQWEVECRN